LLGADNDAIEAFALANGFTNPDGSANFSTGGPAAVAAGVGNRTQIIRNEQGVLLRLLPNFINASSADVSGIDVTASYSFDSDFGNWRVGITGAYVREYEVDTGSAVINSVGVFTDTNPVARTLPEYKINGTINWSYGNHRAFVLIKYIDKLEADAVTGGDIFAAAGIATVQGAAAAAEFLSPGISAHTTGDIQYSYTFGENGWLSRSEISVGIQNVTNEEPPVTPSITGFDPTVHDPRGRIFFVRIGGSL